VNVTDSESCSVIGIGMRGADPWGCVTMHLPPFQIFSTFMTEKFR
jgi:hypothetical protein